MGTVQGSVGGMQIYGCTGTKPVQSLNSYVSKGIPSRQTASEIEELILNRGMVNGFPSFSRISLYATLYCFGELSLEGHGGLNDAPTMEVKEQAFETSFSYHVASGDYTNSH